MTDTNVPANVRLDLKNILYSEDDVEQPLQAEEVNTLFIKKKGLIHTIHRKITSINFIFCFIVISGIVCSSIAVWVVYSNAVSGPISGMSLDIRKSIVNQMETFITKFVTDRENSVINFAKIISVGAAPYMTDTDSFDVVVAGKFLWLSMHTVTDIWIMNVQISQGIAMGYALEIGTNTYSAFDRIDRGNVTGGYWELRGGQGQVDQITGLVNYSCIPEWTSTTHKATIWPGIYDSLYGITDTSIAVNLTDIKQPYYFPSSPSNPAVDNFFPQYGLEYTFIYPFASPDGNGGYIGSFAAVTFNTKYLLNVIQTINLRGGIMYLTDKNGYITASSSGHSPIYGPYNMSDLSPQPEMILPYGQFNYTNYPNRIVQVVGEKLSLLYGGYDNIPNQIDTLSIFIDGDDYDVSTILFESAGLYIRLISAIPQSSFIGFTPAAKKDAGLVSMAIGIVIIIIALIACTIYVVRPLSYCAKLMITSITAGRNDKRSLFFSPDQDVEDSDDNDTMSSPQSKSSSSSGDHSSRMSEKQEKKSECNMNFMPYETREIINVSEYYIDVVQEVGRYLPKGLLHSGRIRDIVQSSGIHKRIVSMCAMRLVSFNTITAQFRRQHIASVISDYTISMRRIVERNGGHVITCESDSIFAIWNAPDDIQHHQYLATLSAFECNSKLQELNEGWRKRYKFPTINQNIGLHVGEPNVGNLGGQGQITYYCFGPEVDVTKSLLEQCEKYNASIICTNNMRNSLTKINADKIFAIRNLGKLHYNENDFIICQAVASTLMVDYPSLSNMCILYDKLFDLFIMSRRDQDSMKQVFQLLNEIAVVHPHLYEDQAWLSIKNECTDVLVMEDIAFPSSPQK